MLRSSPAPRSASGNMLYVMAKPPQDLAERIAAHPRAWRTRSPDLLHMTLQPVLPMGALEPEVHDTVRQRMIERCATIEGWSFWAEFNRLSESPNAITLRGGKMAGAEELHAAIVEGLSRDGFQPRPYRLHPHVTVAYKPDGRGGEVIDPLGWWVEEILLVESVVGEGRHVVLGRWPLRPRQGQLFH